jgi:dihydroorotate dehydrogenase (NAD+) catalytic subunit
MTRMTVVTVDDRQVRLPAVDLRAQLGALTLPNPVMTASGCAGYGRELDQFFDVREIGAVVTKTIMAKPRSGRATPRMAETPSGMLNSIGLQGPGIDRFVEHDLAWLAERGARAVVSIAGSTAEEFGRLAARLRHSASVTAVEVNISCPNVESRGQVFACDPAATASVVQGVRRNTAPGVPVFAKLSPDVTDIVQIARAAVDSGADGLTMVNTLLGVVIDTETMRPHLAGTTGGLSGPGIRPVAVRAVWQVHQALPDVPLIGVGGIRTGADAFEFILAGASAVQVGTAIFNDPCAPVRVRDELHLLLGERGFDRLADAVGHAHRAAEPPAPGSDGAPAKVGEPDSAAPDST